MQLVPVMLGITNGSQFSGAYRDIVMMLEVGVRSSGNQTGVRYNPCYCYLSSMFFLFLSKKNWDLTWELWDPSKIGLLQCAWWATRRRRKQDSNQQDWGHQPLKLHVAESGTAQHVLRVELVGLLWVLEGTLSCLLLRTSKCFSL